MKVIRSPSGLAFISAYPGWEGRGLQVILLALGRSKFLDLIKHFHLRGLFFSIRGEGGVASLPQRMLYEFR